MSFKGPDGEIMMYVGDDGKPRIEVKFQGETAWLSQTQLVELFQSSKANISEHISNIFDEGELQEDAVVREFRTTAADGRATATVGYIEH